MTPKAPTSTEQVRIEEDGDRFPIAGVGASAGGLESLEKMFRALPSRVGIAFVVVQHLAPDVKSLMDELLARFTDLPIQRADDGVEVRPDQVYLLPPGKEIEIREGRLRLFDRESRTALTLPIDRFLASLAKDAAERAIAVILSGSGTDGSRGVRRIHEAGGMVLVEDPDHARFDGMPRAAIESGSADVVLPAEGIAGTLAERGTEGELALPGPQREALTRIVGLLRGLLGIDFGQYKLPTVMRRIQRRLALLGLAELDPYIDLLQTDPDELSALGQDLLIGVTSFYRDPATWEVLDTNVFPLLAADADPERGLRAWVSGCATGEEAYSLAICLLDAAAARPGLQVRVFATDVHRRALETAGLGIYEADRLADMDERRRQRHFIQRPDGRYQVNQRLRHSVVFAHHNVLKDAPFTQLDFISCRNLLIYFRPAAQKQALSLLQYGLRIGGVFLLGPSESLGELAADFEVVDESHRLFRKLRQARRPPELSMTRQLSALPRTGRPAVEPPLLGLYDAILDRVMPPSFLIDEERRVIDSFAGAERMLKIRPRRPSTDLLDLVPEGARLALAGLLSRVTRERLSASFHGVEWEHDGEVGRYDLQIEPIDAAGISRAFLVQVRSAGAVPETAPAETEELELGDLTSERFVALEMELRQSKESLQSAIEELETNSEEMQATNEELVASNEELQSTNEELHSVNEELHTVNAELQTKIHELSELNRDMRRLFDNIESAIVFLDAGLRIRRFTPRAAELFGLVDHDVGRPLASFRHPLKRPGLMDDIARCRDLGEPCEYEIGDIHGRTYLLRLNAYAGLDGIDGVVLSVTDLSQLAAARQKVELLSAIVESTADAVIGLDAARRITAWNAAAVRLYGYSEEEALGGSFDRLVPPGELPELVETLGRVWAGGIETLETVRLHRDGTLIDVSTTLSPTRNNEGTVVGISKIDRDTRERKRHEALLARREARLADLYDNSPDMLTSLDLRSGRVVEFNQTLCRTLGYTPEEIAGMHFSQLYAAECRDASLAYAEKLRQTGELHDAELTMRRKDGSRLEVSISATGLRDEQGEVVRSRSVIRDVTARKEAARERAEAIRLRERFLATVSHELRTPLYALSSATTILGNPDTADDARQRALEVLQRQTVQMTRLLDDLLDVSLITQERFQLLRVPLDLRGPVKAAVDACASWAQADGVELVNHAAEGPLRMLGDPARLQQVFANLIGNAIRHTPAGGRVTVTTERVGDVARAVVADDGIGIAAASLEAIFDLFAQERPAGRGRGSGLGLGLSVARQIVAGHGGAIAAQSEGTGQGARFVVELAVDDSARAQAQEPAEPGRLRIVLVEDQPDSREMAALLLTLRGHEVTAVETGEKAVAAILEQRPHVALVDIGLPDIDGYEVARAVRTEAGDSVPLVALTGYGQPEDIRRSRDAGFARHLTKPLAIDLLEQILQEVAQARSGP